MKKIGLLLVAALLCVVLLAGCGKTVWFDIEELAVEAAFSATEDAGDWYYIDNGAIYAQPKGAKKATVLATLPVQEDGLPEIQVAGEYLYFSCGAYSLYRVPVSGGQPERLLDIRHEKEMNAVETIHSWVLHNDKIYIQLGFPIFCYDIASGTVEQLIEDAGEYALHEGVLYYIPHASRTFTIYRVDLRSGQETIFLGDGIYEPDKTKAKELYKSLLFAGDDLYYYKRNPDGLYRYQDGQSYLISASESINEFSLCVYDNALYYVIEKEDGARLMRYERENGKITERQMLADFSRDLTVKYGFVYYKNTAGDLIRKRLT